MPGTLTSLLKSMHWALNTLEEPPTVITPNVRLRLREKSLRVFLRDYYTNFQRAPMANSQLSEATISCGAWRKSRGMA
jgi:hypothetical protein